MTLYAEKLLPHNLEAEEAVIGSLLIDGECFSRVAPILQPGDFYRERNQLCFAAALAMFQRDEAIDQLTLAGELARTERLDVVGGMAYLSHLVSITPTSVHSEDYAEIVSRTATMRKLIDAAAQISALGYNDTDDIGGTLQQAEDALFAVRGAGQTRGFIPLRQIYDQYLQDRAGVAEPLLDGGGPVMSGYADLDELLGGIQRSDMVILGARPSLGKSTLALNICLNAARNGSTSGIFSLEMSREQLAMRILSSEAEVDSHRLRLDLTTFAEQQRIIDAIGQLSDLPVYIDDTPYQSLVEMRGKARRLSLERGLDLLVVDYLQLVQGAEPWLQRQPGAGNQRDFPFAEGLGSRPERRCGRLFPVEQVGGEPAQSPAAAIGPARQRQYRAGCRRGDVHSPRGRLHHRRRVGAAASRPALPRGHRRDHSGQAPQRTDGQHTSEVPQ